MDVNSGSLIRDLMSLDEEERKKYTPVPKALEEEARERLGNYDRVMVSLGESSNLARWAANQRKKARVRAKLAKKSRKKNR